MIEQGTHDELMQKRGDYYDLVMAQVGENNNEDEIEGENGKVIFFNSLF